MALDFTKWDGMDFNDLGAEGDFPEIPYGTYEVKVNNIELKESKKGSLMIVFEFEIINGDFEKSRLWYNQVIEAGFGKRKAKEMIESLLDGGEFTYGSNLRVIDQQLKEVLEETKQFEYALKYSVNKKGYNEYEVTEVFEVE